ncbi:MAG: Sec-independent protein translocase protein TatB [Ilumatobacter sp.]
MFNLQGGELVIIALLALVVLGPEKLPEAMRHVGRLMRQMRGVRDTFQREFKQALDEPMRDLRRATTGSADELRRAAKSMVEPESDSTSEDAAAASASESEAPVADDVPKVTESGSVAEPVNSPDAPATETDTGTSEAVDEGEADASMPFEAGQDVDETSAEER